MSIGFLLRDHDLRDHDAKFSRSFDAVFTSEATELVRTPIQAPKANASAERWVQTAQTECLDWMLLLGRHHLLRILRSYLRHDNQQRPHRGLALAVPDPPDHGDLRQGSRPIPPHDVGCRDVVGGLIRSITRSQHDEPGFRAPHGGLRPGAGRPRRPRVHCDAIQRGDRLEIEGRRRRQEETTRRVALKYCR